MRPGGFGISIARAIADELLYNEAQNEVVLIKYLSEAMQNHAEKIPHPVIWKDRIENPAFFISFRSTRQGFRGEDRKLSDDRFG